jgi:hypothetical protein
MTKLLFIFYNDYIWQKYQSPVDVEFTIQSLLYTHTNKMKIFLNKKYINNG